MATENIGNKAKLGVVYSSLGRLGVTAIILVRTVVLVRLLPVRDFGVMQLCFTIVDLATTAGDFGFSAAQVQQKAEVTLAQTNTLFLIDLALKSALFSALMLGLPWVADYFHEPQLSSVLPALAAYVIVDCFSVPGLTLLSRRMAFGTTAKIEFASRTAEALFAIALALLGFGIWSLVLGRLLGSLVSSVLACVAGGWRPSLHFDFAGSRALLNFGGWLFFRNLFNYFTDNVDYFVVGRFLGSRELGFYSKAFEVMRLPQARLTRAIAIVLFPAFSRIQDDRARVGSGLRKVVLATALVAYPVLIGLALVSYEFVEVLFGARWLPMAAPLRIMCLAGVVHAVDPFLLSAFTALGMVRVATFRRLAEFLLLAVGVYFGVSYGIRGVAVAVVVVAVTTTLATSAFAHKLSLSGWRDYLRPQMPALLASLVMSFVVLGGRWLLVERFGLSPLARLPLLIVLGAVGYAASLLALRDHDVAALWREGAGDASKVRRFAADKWAAILRRLGRS